MTDSDSMAARNCARHFTILPEGDDGHRDVRVTWACGAHRIVRDEPAVDLEFLAEHLGYLAHHHHHFHPVPRKSRLKGATL